MTLEIDETLAHGRIQTKYVGPVFTSGVDVATASRTRPPVIKYTNGIKWTSTVSNKFVFDVGYGTSVNAFTEKYQPGVLKDPFTPAWYATAGRQDITRSTTTMVSTPETGTYNFRYMVMSTMQYVTGSHAVKAGVQWHIGQTWNMADANADLVQRSRDGVPDSVIVYKHHRVLEVAADGADRLLNHQQADELLTPRAWRVRSVRQMVVRS